LQKFKNFSDVAYIQRVLTLLLLDDFMRFVRKGGK